MKTRIPAVTLPGHRVAVAKFDYVGDGDVWVARCECGYSSGKNGSPSAALKCGRDHQDGILRQHEDMEFRLKAVNANLPADHQIRLEPYGDLYCAVCSCTRYRSTAGDPDAAMRLGASHAGAYVKYGGLP